MSARSNLPRSAPGARGSSSAFIGAPFWITRRRLCATDGSDVNRQRTILTVLPGHPTTDNAADRESHQAPEESADARRDTQRHERMPSHLYGGLGGAIFDRMTPGDSRASDVPHVLFEV